MFSFYFVEPVDLLKCLEDALSVWAHFFQFYSLFSFCGRSYFLNQSREFFAFIVLSF